MERQMQFLIWSVSWKLMHGYALTLLFHTNVPSRLLIPFSTGRNPKSFLLTLRDPMDCSLPGSSVHGIFQARILEWGAIALLTRLQILTVQESSAQSICPSHFPGMLFPQYPHSSHWQFFKVFAQMSPSREVCPDCLSENCSPALSPITTDPPILVYTSYVFP